jgi:hypothetical protein
LNSRAVFRVILSSTLCCISIAGNRTPRRSVSMN